MDILKERCKWNRKVHQARQPSMYEMVFQWVSEVWKMVAKPKFFVSGFRQYGQIEWENGYQRLHSTLRKIP